MRGPVAGQSPQVRAANPSVSAFVEANAGSGKTRTLVDRVARLLLRGAAPEAILCVTYTKAGAAEMERRLFETLGGWAIAEDSVLAERLAAIDESGADAGRARTMFARALETPGGLKIQTIHAFCEQLLRRFPIEAGLSPAFTVLDDTASAAISGEARADVARLALTREEVREAFDWFSLGLDPLAFDDLFRELHGQRAAIAAWREDAEGRGGAIAEVWRACGFDRPTPPEAVEREAVARIRWKKWAEAAEGLLSGSPKVDRGTSERMRTIGPESTLDEIIPIFLDANGKPRSRLGGGKTPAGVREWLQQEQARWLEVLDRHRAALVATETCHALVLAAAYAGFHEGAKRMRGALDFDDLIAATRALLTEKADAAWVLYKLDGGIDHLLLDEAQDTAPLQWDILRALTAEFFTGAGAAQTRRTVFAVGDVKQSIFSFQGAAPERLAQETAAFAALARQAALPFERINLRESYRSAPEILAFVDAVFEAPDLLAGLSPAQGDNVLTLPVTHQAYRPAGGCVELWPLVEGDTSEERDPWDPVDAPNPRSADRELAARIAANVVAMVERGEAVTDRADERPRPCRFGDVLILAARRRGVFQEIIRALKRAGAPVAGADRLKLSEHGAFQDLVALGRFARFQNDDLTLAALLRGPFCSVEEEALFGLAYGRRGGLWAELSARADEAPAYAQAVAFLGQAIEAADAAPFDFYARILARLDDEGRSMRQRLLTRLGAEAEQAIDAFLDLSLAAERRGERDLESFLASVSATEVEIKREAEEGPGAAGGEVRVMTAHGAKGLEAPIVILGDATCEPVSKVKLLARGGGGFLWAPAKKGDCAASAEARALREAADARESARLFYVALTRARDRLIVAGKAPKRNSVETWYDHVAGAFDRLETRAFPLAGGQEALRFGPDPALAAAAETPGPAAGAPPAWVLRPAPSEPVPPRWASPSQAGGGESDAAVSPLARTAGLGRWRRGTLIHGLLQRLPDLPEASRAQAAAALMARERDLTDEQRAEMADAALAVLADPRFAAVFGPGSRAEVALAGAAPGLPEGLAVAGRVDRLVVEADRVLVVDFKTNRPPPAAIEAADPAYIVQMAVYAAVLAEIFPGRAVGAALLWTDGPSLMEVPPARMAEALASLRRGGAFAPVDAAG